MSTVRCGRVGRAVGISTAQFPRFASAAISRSDAEFGRGRPLDLFFPPAASNPSVS